MSASPKTFFVNLPCPKCGEETWGAIVMHVEDYVATVTDVKHFEVCGAHARERLEKKVERAYLKAGQPLKGVRP